MRAVAGALATVAILLFASRAHAESVRLVGGAIDTTRRTPAPAAQAVAKSARSTRIVQLSGPIRKEWIAEMRAAGAVLHAYLPDYAYLVTADAHALDRLESMSFVRWIGTIPPAVKLHPRLSARSKSEPQARVDVTILSVDDMPDRELRRWGFPPRSSRQTRMGWRDTRVTVPASRLMAIAELESVFHIEPQPAYELHGERAAQIAAGAYAPGSCQPSGPGYPAFLAAHGLNGAAGLIVQVQDDGIDQGDTSGAPGTAHEDLRGRIAGIFNATSDPLGDSTGGHGQINASIIAGNASLGATHEGYAVGQGMAPSALVYGTKIFNNSDSFDIGSYSFADLAKDAQDAGAIASNNSWGSNEKGAYTADSAEFDALTRDADPFEPGNQQMIYVFSAGNHGPAYSGTRLGTLGSPATAKNVIAVGAAENTDQDGVDGCIQGTVNADCLRDIANFSSGGPDDDGRLGVTVVSVGTHVRGAVSTSPEYDGRAVCDQYWPAAQTDYARSSGTSHSAAVVTGASLIVYELFQRQLAGLGHTANPSPALVKAVLTNTATDLVGGDDWESPLTNAPNTVQGWGGVNLATLLDMSPHFYSVDQTEIFTSSGESFEVALVPAVPGLPMKVTLAWTDAPAMPGTSPNLVNDLDLVVVDGGSTFRGNVFEAGTSVAGGLPDRLNNLEAVYLQEPSGGPVTIRVIAENIPGDGVPGVGGPTDQDFALFVWNATQATDAGAVSLGANPLACSDVVEITLADLGLAGAGSYLLSLTTSSGDAEDVELAESPSGTGVFRAAIPTSTGPVVAFDGALQIADGASIQATYADADDGSGAPALSTDALVMDCVGPEVAAVATVFANSVVADVEITFAEPASVELLWGTSCATLSQSQSDPLLDTSHTFRFTSLTADTTYYFSIQSTDALGNVTTDDNGGACYTFASTLVPDYFTERFLYTEPESDLDHRVLFFQPNESVSAYSLCSDPASTFPTDPTGGSRLELQYNDFQRIALTGATVKLYGVEYPELYVGSNGYVTFGEGDTERVGTFPNHFRLPRISAMFDNLNPGDGQGSISWKQLPDRVALTFDGVTQYARGPVSFQTELFFDGRIRITYLDIARFTGVAGLSRGERYPADFVESDLSEYPTCVTCAGALAIQEHSLRCGGPLTVTLGDADLGAAGVGAVTVTTSGGDVESLALSWAGGLHAPGSLEGQISTQSGTAVPGDGVIQVSDGDIVTASYTDADDCTGSPAEVSDLVVADCTAPVPDQLAVSKTTARTADISMDFSEYVSATVQYGLSCASLDKSETEHYFKTHHSIRLDWLTAVTTYYFAVSAIDSAGNVGIDDNGGQCYSFTTTEQPDYFTQYFENSPLDIENTSLLFQPDGSFSQYTLCQKPASSFPTDPDGGIELRYDDFSLYREVALSGAPVPLYGVDHSEFNVYRLGYVTFGIGNIDPTYVLEDHFALPRITATRTSAYPWKGGKISWKQLPDRVAVTFDQVESALYYGTDSYQIEMFYDGRIRITLLDMNLQTADIVGISEGGGKPPDYLPSDLSSYPLCDYCGDGVLDPGEACDEGPANGAPTSCCTTGCELEQDGESCDDGDACTTADSCGALGVCSGLALSCDDANPCTDDGCIPSLGCVYTDNDAPCDDLNTCTVGDRCATGTCQPGAPLVCTDGEVCTDDGCDPASGCVFTNNEAACDDGSACTTADRCSGGACASGDPVECDDGNPCTVESCDDLVGCQFIPVVGCTDVPMSTSYVRILVALGLMSLGLHWVRRLKRRAPTP